MAFAGPTTDSPAADQFQGGQAVPGTGSSGAERPRLQLRRYPDRGILGGVCAGVAAALGVEPLLVRFLTAIMIAAGGVGIAIYAIAWALLPVAAESEGVLRPSGAARRVALMALAVAMVFVGVRLTGFRVGDTIIWPIVVGACGLALAWRVLAGSEPLLAGWRAPAEGGRPRSWQTGARGLLFAVLLVAFGSAALLHTFGVLRNLGKEVGAAAIIATTLILLVGPWAVRLARSLSSEREARIREQERAELAAHLHDSVLQTLALIQTRAGDAREVATLARRQERELRHWLQEGHLPGEGEGVRTALERVATDVEELHGVPIEVIVVGDAPLDERLQAIVQAAREALVNAAKFAGSERVDLFAEITPSGVEVFVRDRGVGFDTASIPADRRGVRDSILGRMERHGGRGAIHSEPGAGTEVELSVQRLHYDRGQIAMRPVSTEP